MISLDILLDRHIMCMFAHPGLNMISWVCFIICKLASLYPFHLRLTLLLYSFYLLFKCILIIFVGWCWSCWKDAFCSARKEIWLWSKTSNNYLRLSVLFTNSSYPIIFSLKVIVFQMRLAGDLLMELGAGVELATAAVPQLFLPLACAANVVKVDRFLMVSDLMLCQFCRLICQFLLLECCCCDININ